MDIQEDTKNKRTSTSNKNSINHFIPSIRSRRSNQSAFSNLGGSIDFKPWPQKMSLQSNISQKARMIHIQQDLFDQISFPNGPGLHDIAFKNRNSFGQITRMNEENTRRSDVVDNRLQNPRRKIEEPQRISIQSPVKQEQPKLSCKCAKSKCLLMYCECFSKGLVCNETCSCYQCRNNHDFEDKRQKARNSVLQKNPNAFNSKFEMVGGETNINMAYSKGCNCKKTLCFKKYCECFYAGVKCTYLCKCQNCMNGGQNAFKQ